MIVKYDIKKQYQPDDLKNKVRRMQRVPMEMTYQKRLISNKILFFLTNIPIVKYTITLSLNVGQKLIIKMNNRMLLSKEDNNGINISR